MVNCVSQAYLQAVGLDAQQYEALKHGLAQPSPCGLLVHDHGPQLAVVPHQHHLLGAQHQGQQALRLSCLRALIHQHLQQGVGDQVVSAKRDSVLLSRLNAFMHLHMQQSSSVRMPEVK